MACTSMLRGALAGHVAMVALLALCGTAAPMALGQGAHGRWALELKVALADSGRGGGNGGSGSGRGGGSSGSSGSGSGGDDGGSSGSGSGSGGDDGGSSSSGGGGDGSSGSGSGGDDGGRSGSDDGGSSGSGSGGNGSGSGSGESGSPDAGSGASGKSGSGRRGSDDTDGARGDARGDDRDRPRAEVDLSDRELDAVMRGERVLVDDRGRVLEVEIEIEHGVRTVTVKPHGGDVARNPGPIGGVRAVDAATTPSRQVVVDPRAGELEVEIEHGVATTKPHASARPAANRDPVQAGGDLTPAEEAALIQSGWQ